MMPRFDDIDLKHTFSSGFWTGYATGLISAIVSVTSVLWALEHTRHLMIDWFF